jgi:hypothetical protein
MKMRKTKNESCVIEAKKREEEEGGGEEGRRGGGRRTNPESAEIPLPFGAKFVKAPRAASLAESKLK